MKFLIVDDFPSIRKVIISLLKDLGYSNFLEADNGKNAIDILNSNDVNFIISDWNMPIMDGLEFLSYVKSNKEFLNIPFILLTAEAKKENILNAAKLGVDGYIVKPFNQITFKEKLDYAFKKYKININ